MPSGRRESTESISSNPLAFQQGALELQFEEFSLDGDEEYFEADVDGQRVSLTEWEDQWNKLTLRGELSIDTDLGESVFPEMERDDPPGRLVLAVDCEATHYRRGHGVDVDDLSAGTTTVELTVESKNHYGRFEVTPHFVRTEPGDPSTTYRTTPGIELANGEPVIVEIDEAEEGEDSLLPAKFKSFGASESDQFPDDAVYVVDKSEPSRPKLFVNSDHEPIRDALRSGPHGYIGHVMMAYRDLLFAPAFNELVVWTADDVEEDGSTAHDWQDALLEQIGTGMYDVSDGTTAGQEMYAEREQEGSTMRLLDRSSKAIQDYFELDDSMNTLVERLR